MYKDGEREKKRKEKKRKEERRVYNTDHNRYFSSLFNRKLFTKSYLHFYI
jgi:hypothetical protein